MRKSGLQSGSLEAPPGEAEERRPEDPGVPGDPLPQQLCLDYLPVDLEFIPAPPLDPATASEQARRYCLVAQPQSPRHRPSQCHHYHHPGH